MNRSEKASVSYDITTSLGRTQVPEYDELTKVGMLVNLSLHIRDLPPIKFEILKLAAPYYFNIPGIILPNLLYALAEIEFVKLDTEGTRIKTVIPDVPFFEDIYDRVGEYAENETQYNESEDLALVILTKLSQAPTFSDTLYDLGAEKNLVKRGLDIGQQGGYLLTKRARGKDVLLSPIFFAQNADLYADLVAKSGSSQIQKILKLIEEAQGWPLALIETREEINGVKVTQDEINLLKRLAQDGQVKPPSITTKHKGENFFLFTPAPGSTKLNPANRVIYERAMALIAAVRQGQLLPKEYRIRNPRAILNALRSRGFIGSNSEAMEQYRNLSVMKVGKLVQTSGNRYQFQLIKNEENRQALDTAIEMLDTGGFSSLEINEEAQIALQKEQTYIESIISAAKLRQTETVPLSEEHKEELENLFIKAANA
ncbi:MAG: hypothetical protein R8P61_28345 [Bacteroidia bacterium]|nr:hypothetical protein [Bacteroidia bacterium]